MALPDIEFIKRLAETLRSGEFEQGANRLRGNGKFCPLGVACELHRRENPEKWEWRASVKLPGVHAFAQKGDTGRPYHVPREVSQRIGGTAIPILFEMNDRYGASFAAIADWLDSYATAIEGGPLFGMFVSVTPPTDINDGEGWFLK